MVMGHHRRVYLPIPVLLRLAVEGQVKDRGRVDYACGRESGAWYSACSVVQSLIRLLTGLELLQRPERPLLSHPEIENQ